MSRRAKGEHSVRKRKNGRWEARAKRGDRGMPVSFSRTADTRDDALRLVTEAVREWEAGQALDVTGRTRLGAYLQWWIDVELAERVRSGDHFAESTRSFYAGNIRNHIAPTDRKHASKAGLARIPIGDLNPAKIRSWMHALAAAGLGDSGRKKAHSTLQAALSTAVRYEIIARNPASNVRAPKVRRARKEQVTFNDARGILDASKDSRLHALYVLMLHVPMRPGEALGSEWDCFTLDESRFELRQNVVKVDGRWRLHDMKRHEARTVPLAAAAVDALRGQRVRQKEWRLAAGGWQTEPVFDVRADRTRTPDLTFTQPDGRIVNKQYLGRDLKRVCEAGGVRPLAPHDLRRGAITLLRELGTDAAVVQQMAGHRTLQMTDLYTGSLYEAMRKASDALGQELSADGA